MKSTPVLVLLCMGVVGCVSDNGAMVCRDLTTMCPTEVTACTLGNDAWYEWNGREFECFEANNCTGAEVNLIEICNR